MPAGVVVPAQAGLECSARAADACAVSASDDRKLSVATYLDEMRRPISKRDASRNEAPKHTRGAMKGDRPMTKHSKSLPEAKPPKSQARNRERDGNDG
jgi:hypothetical protein